MRDCNYISLATSYNMKSWALVAGSNPDVVDRLPALNNQTPVYNINFPELETANVSGVVATAVRGRDITIKVTPKNASHMIDAVVNGDTIATAAKSFSYSFIAKQDMDFDIKVYPPVSLTEATIVLGEGEHLYLTGTEGIKDWGIINYATAQKYTGIKKLTIKGQLDYYDFNLFRENAEVAESIQYLDLSEVTIVHPRDEESGLDNVFPRNAFCSENQGAFSGLIEIKLPATVQKFDDYCFKGCKFLKEVTLPSSLYYGVDAPMLTRPTSIMFQGGLGLNCFSGCTSLTTIHLPCVPGPNGLVHHMDYTSYAPNNLGLADCSKVTVVVPAEYLEVYKTPHSGNGYFESGWNNGWVLNNFNIVGEYPVYSLNYDTSRCFVADKEFDEDNAASFLKDNVALESISLNDMLYVGVLSNKEGRPEGTDEYREGVNVRVYDNGRLLPEEAVSADGAVSLTYWNPNQHADLSGNHEIEVAYLYDVLFNCISDQFTVLPEIRNDEEENGETARYFEVLDSSNAAAPVLKNVGEDSAVRFAIGFSTDNHDLTPRVKVGDQVLEADEEGYYTVNIEDADVTVEIYAIPSNGATLTTEEIVSVNTAEAADVTTLSLQGEIDSETLAIVVNGFESLESLDLSDMQSEIPANAFEGKSTLKVVVLPEVDAILPNTFKDCENLTTVTVPESVTMVGEGAFSGCSSLETITLTGIDAMGAGAFSGCDNLTSITLNPASSAAPAAAPIRAKAPRITGFDEAAFDGLNPNCFIILGEGVAMPASVAGNYLTTRVGEIEDIDSDGGISTRQGRIYESAGDIALTAGYPLAVANKFSMIDGDRISCTVNVPAASEGWTTLVVPFDVESVTADGEELVAKTSADQESATADYMVASLMEGDREIALRAGVAANVPSLIKQTKSKEARDITFSASDVTVAATAATVAVSGADYDLTASYRTAKLPAETTYVLNEAGTAFEALESDSEDAAATIEVAPFEVYAVGAAGQGKILIGVAGDDIETGVDTVALPEGMKVAAENGQIVIYVDEAKTTAIYSADGRMVGTITLNPGRNVVTGLAGGIYIVEGVKIVL